MALIRIRPAQGSDAVEAIQVVRRSIVELCRADHHDDEATLSRWLANKSAASFSKWIADAENHCVIGELDGVLCGVGLLRRDGQILLFYVKPEAIGVGLGREIHRTLEIRAGEWELPLLHLCSTEHAKGFYQRLGYRPNGPRRHVHGKLWCYPYIKTLSDVRQSR